MGVLERFQRQSMCGNSIGDGEERIQAFQSADSIVNYTDSICRPLCVLQQPDWSPGVQSHSPLPHSRRTTCTPSQPPRTCSDPTFSSGPMPNPGHPLLKQPRLDSLDGLKRRVSAATVIGWVQRTRKWFHRIRHQDLHENDSKLPMLAVFMLHSQPTTTLWKSVNTAL